MNDSKSRGLKTIENDKFLKFWDILQKQAGRKGMVFFLDCGEGNDEIINDIEVSDLSGWLIPRNKADLFESEWKRSGDMDETWDDFFVFVKWQEKDNYRF